MSGEYKRRRLLTDKEVAEEYGFSRWAINEARRRGTMPGVIMIPGIRRAYYSAQAIDEWINNLQQGTEKQGLRIAK